jgi:hypothetical protein
MRVDNKRYLVTTEATHLREVANYGTSQVLLAFLQIRWWQSARRLQSAANETATEDRETRRTIGATSQRTEARERRDGTDLATLQRRPSGRA